MGTMERAIKLATEQHKDQTLNGKPYIAHAELVYEIVKELKPHDEDSQVAAWLHDVVEDTVDTILGKAILLSRIEISFGDKVAQLVRELTENDNERKQVGKVAYDTQSYLKMSDDALTLRLADRLSHTRNIFGMNADDTYKNAMVTKLVLENVMKYRKLNKEQLELVEKFNKAFDKLTIR